MPTKKSNKRSKTKRDPRDWYPTPCGAVRAILSADLLPMWALPRNLRILDAGAGLGPWGVVARELWPLAHIEGFDLHFDWAHPDYSSWVVGDFLNNHYQDDEFHLVMGNPPYALAEEFIRESIRISKGLVVFLLRVGFLGSQTRMHGLFKEMPPTDVMVMGRRVSFTGNGKTDIIDYAVYVWDVDNFNVVPRIHWLDWDYEPMDRWSPYFQQDLSLLSAPMIAHLMRTHGVV